MKSYKSIDFDESVWADVVLNGNAKLIVGCIQKLKYSDEGNYEKLYSLINKVNECGATHILVVGDFNYPELNWGDDEPVAGIGARNSALKFLECSLLGMCSSRSISSNQLGTYYTRLQTFWTLCFPTKKEW